MADDDEVFETLSGMPDDPPAPDAEDKAEDKTEDKTEDTGDDELLGDEQPEIEGDFDAEVPGLIASDLIPDDEEDEEDEDDEDDDDVDDIDDILADVDDEDLDDLTTPPDLADIKNPRIRERIMRERRLAGEVIESAQEQMRSLRNGNWKTTNDIHTRRINEVRRLSEGLITAADVVIAANQELMRVARDNGDTDAEFKARETIGQWEQLKNQTRPVLQGAQEDATKLENWRKSLNPNQPVDIEPPRAGGQQGQQGQPEIPPQAMRWIEQNPWFVQPQHEEKKMFAMGIEQKLINAGYRADDPKLFAMVAKQVASKFPDVRVKGLNGKRVGATPAKKARTRNRRPRGEEGPSSRPSTPTKGTGGNRRTGKPSSREAAQMSQFGMNPRDPDAVKAWRAEHKPASRRRAGRSRQTQVV
jgi:hypothetical protein